MSEPKNSGGTNNWDMVVFQASLYCCRIDYCNSSLFVFLSSGLCQWTVRKGTFCIISTVSSSLRYMHTTSYLALQLFFGSWSQDYSRYMCISSLPGSLDMKQQFLPKRSLGMVRSGGTFRSAIWKPVTQAQLPWPYAVLPHDASRLCIPAVLHAPVPGLTCAAPAMWTRFRFTA